MEHKNLTGRNERFAEDLIIFIIGVALNLLGAQLPGLLNIPLFLDNVGTIVVVVGVGTVPGMAAAYIGNVFYSFQQPEWLYWSLFGVIIAAIAGNAVKRGRFTKLTDMLKTVPLIVVFTGVIGEMFSWVLSGFDLEEGATGEYAQELEDILPLPMPVLRIIVCCIIEVIDKCVTFIIAWALIRLNSGLSPNGRSVNRSDSVSPLRNRMIRLITISASATSISVFALACHTYYRSLTAAEELTTLESVRKCLTFGGSLFSAMLGALICLIEFSIAYLDRTLVDPVKLMTEAMRRFIGIDEEEKKYSDAGVVTNVKIFTKDELENLHSEMSMLASDIVRYIQALNAKMKEVSDLQLNIISTMADMIESRDITTGEHVRRTAAYAAIIAEQLRADGRYTDKITDSYIMNLKIAAPLHDVGKICVSDTILNKPGRLTPEEFEIMKTHTTHGRKIVHKALESLGSFEYLDMAEMLTESHHEWWNGKGYPKQLAGQDIPLCARIMAIADVYDALTSERPYKKAFSPEKAMHIIAVEEKGTHFEPAVVDAFVRAYDKIEAARLDVPDGE